MQRLAPALTLSIVSHRHGPLLAQLLDDLASHPALAGVRSIVTLNIDEPFDAARWPALDVVVVRNRAPRGFGANHNAAFTRCATPWFAVLNPDLRLPSDPFPALLDRAAAEPDVALIAPTIVDENGVVEDAVRANLTPLSLVARRLLGRRRPLDPDRPARRGSPFFWVAGMFMLLRSPAFAAVGGFDERYFLYCEDYDLCARLYCAGHAIAVQPAVQVVHEARRASHRSPRYLAWHLASLLRAWRSASYWRVTCTRAR